MGLNKPCPWRDVRKGRGIYYTPRWVVEYIVDNTLGRRLKEMGEEHGLQAIEKVRGLAVLDPACGSCSFLIYAYQVLADFYQRRNRAIEKEQLRLMENIRTPHVTLTECHLCRRMALPPMSLAQEEAGRPQSV